MTDARPFDIILFGATGFVGELVARYLAHTGAELRWALAGRNRAKLEALQRSLPAVAHPIGLVHADVGDVASIEALAKSARVVITTVGPYTRYGEPLVAACAQHGTDYLDLTGEPRFVERMIERYHAPAAQSGAKIVHACGFDSVPHDLGTLFTVHALRRRLAASSRDQTPIRVEAVVQMRGGFSGGTWQSALLIMRDQSLRQPPPIAARPGRTMRRAPARIHYRRELGSWALPMPTIDPEIVLRSASLSAEYGPDFCYGHYLGLRRLPQVIGAIAGVGAVTALAKFEPTRQLLAKLKLPGQGPSAEQREKSHFRVTFFGEAGAERVRCQVSGGDPGYGETAKMLSEAALCLAQDRARLPAASGVLPSAVALGDVLIERLQRAGIEFRELPE